MHHILRTKEVAKRLRVSTGYVRRLIRDKELKAYKVGNRGGFRISEEELDSFITSRLRRT